MRRQKRKYEKPKKPWDKERIAREKELLKKYGLRRKKEIWKAESILRRFRKLARDLLGKEDEKTKKELLGRLYRLGLVEADASLDDVLALTVEDILERRLQTLVFKKGLANTIKQARQFIVHGHIAIDGRRARFPSMLVKRELEDKIGYYSKSPFAANPPVKNVPSVKEGESSGENK
jgi:small subunit ribosomal protein S4